jgi:hypothetical protein
MDKRNMRSYTSQMQQDTSRLYMYTGGPLQGLLLALCSVGVGLIISFFCKFFFMI